MEGTEVRKVAALEDKHWWYAERRHLVGGLIRRAYPAGPDGAVALDVGAAGGGNTRVLAASGFLAVPLEYGDDGAQIARERHLPVVRGDASNLPFASGGADVVVAFDVLEHLADDAGALLEFFRVLRPGGNLWVSVPADMRLWSAHDVAVGHVKRYSRTELENAVRSAGFDLIDVSSWNVLLRPIVDMRRRRATGSDLGDIGLVTNWILARLIALERYVPFLRGRSGVSLILQARRNPTG